MKKFLFIAFVILLVLSMLSGCNKSQAEPPAMIEPIIDSTTESTPAEPTTSPIVEAAPAEPTTLPTVEAAPTESTTSPIVEAVTTGPTTLPAAETIPAETDTASIDEAYREQIARYYTAISEQWDEIAYFDHEMSPMAAFYYEGNALDNVGFAFVDLDGDGRQELIIGAIMNAELHPLVFEIWTIANDEPVMLAQSGSRNRYYLQYTEEDGLWSVANEAENSAASHAVYYLQLSDGKFEVIQGILFDAMANENDPWFMAYDLDWDASNDMPIDEDTANSVMEAQRNTYIAMEYRPYSLYK